ncbi:flagellar hook capping FlgD N-terminal domain-containing protein [Paracoccus sediminicola]|uniref:flagellar hook capping FlgD N-terminal domain-containing protein n=1 Tax=Paracoccus sediminicola TaxID=3017783 RepID=UPI0022F12617|nr:flagellar hook capping FlgD N-terminal domain-containing protein [Paracoccus sediminicola]WBU56878.1 flagellar basal body rod modification protein [Paracoccus sediminicola]
MVTTNPTAAPAVAPPPTASPPSKASFAGGDFETFLKMLTAQIKNQDPMNPMEGADFAVQLATFSGVEQQVKTNDLLEKIAGQSGAGALSGYSDWIGKKVRTTGEVYFGEQPLTMEIQPDPAADEVILVATDQYGREISREDIGTGAGTVEWFGRDAGGDRLPQGLYRFSLESMRGGEVIARSDVPSYSAVQEIQMGDRGVSFVLSGGAMATLDEVDALAM